MRCFNISDGLIMRFMEQKSARRMGLHTRQWEVITRRWCSFFYRRHFASASLYNSNQLRSSWSFTWQVQSLVLFDVVPDWVRLDVRSQSCEATVEPLLKMVVLELLLPAVAQGIQTTRIIATSPMFKLVLMVICNVWSWAEGVASQRW